MTLPKEVLERIEREAEKFQRQCRKQSVQDASGSSATRAGWCKEDYKRGAIAEAQRAQGLVEALEKVVLEGGGPGEAGQAGMCASVAFDALASYREGEKK